MVRITRGLRQNFELILRAMTLSLVLFSLTGCNSQPSIYSFSLENMEGELIDFSSLKSQKATVFIILSPDCPLCQKYSLSFRELDSAFSDKNIAFLGIFPGEYYSIEEMKNYVHDYEIPFECVRDPKMLFTERLSAEVTPEVFVFNSDEKLIYSGAIDNWAVTVRKHRQVVNEFYLNDALQSILAESDLRIRRVDPVGCLIQ